MLRPPKNGREPCMNYIKSLFQDVRHHSIVQMGHTLTVLWNAFEESFSGPGNVFDGQPNTIIQQRARLCSLSCRWEQNGWNQQIELAWKRPGSQKRLKICNQLGCLRKDDRHTSTLKLQGQKSLNMIFLERHIDVYQSKGSKGASDNDIVKVAII